MTPFLPRFDAFHDQAVQATGLDDFGPKDYVDPLKLLLSDYDKYEDYDPVIDQLISGATAGLLASRLFAHKGFTEHPEFVTSAIKKPIIILGLPRTGSTALHRLLAKDPANQWLPPWLGNTPMPRPPRETWDSNPCYQMTAQGLQQFYELFPAIKAMHPMVAELPDECRMGIEPSFWSPGLAFGGTMHDYAKWILNSDADYAYHYYRKVLGLIAGGDTRRWVLKDPTTHPWAPQSLLATFPDACFVNTHRDPVTALTSLADMMYVVRHARAPALSPQQNGREQLAFWGPAVGKQDEMLSGLGETRVVNVHINELHADPVGTAERIYRHFGFPVSEEARTAWQAHIAADARAGHGAHHYKTENVGLTPREIYEGVGAYYDTYMRLYGHEKK